jgi:diaminopimelate decarboxylase
VSGLTGRPPAFSYQAVRKGLLRRASRESILQCDEIPLPRLAERYGTPLYVYSATTIRERARAFQRAFRKADFTLCYSVKANSNLSILRLLANLECGFDVVSGGELERVLHLGRKAAKKVVFSGVGKQREELEAALQAGILLFNVESKSELLLLAECASRLKRSAPVALRVNPDVPAKTHPYISTGLQQHKFGIPVGQARQLYARASGMKSLKTRGVSVHIGSQITEVEPFTLAMERVADLVRDLRKDGHRIEYVDAGGGLGIAYEGADGPEFGHYASALLRPLKGLKVHLLLEPGRSIVGPSGALVTRVLYRKTNNGKKFVIVDAAMNDLLRPSLYNAFHEIVPVQAQKDPATETVDLVGPVCETGDFFARSREIPVVAEGDLLAILDVGAYGMALSSNYNTRPRAAEVLVDGKTARVIRRRESVKDLLRAEEPG